MFGKYMYMYQEIIWRALKVNQRDLGNCKSIYVIEGLCHRKSWLYKGNVTVYRGMLSGHQGSVSYFGKTDTGCVLVDGWVGISFSEIVKSDLGTGQHTSVDIL